MSNLADDSLSDPEGDTKCNFGASEIAMLRAELRIARRVNSALDEALRVLLRIIVLGATRKHC